jgi:DNA helicase II / ATP-dependent DNA helicase PcrA
MNLTPEDKALIEQEEALFQKTLDSLYEQLPQALSAKLSARNEAREMTSRMVNEWNDEARQALVSDEAVAHRISSIRNDQDKILMELVREPYFGRVMTKEEDGHSANFLIGIRGNPSAGIVDWRSGPLAALYFNYKQGDDFFEVINGRERIGRVTLRNSFKTENGQLVQIESSEGVFQRKETGWMRLDVDSEIEAMRSRSPRTTEKRLPSILSLITPEQFEMITSDPHRPVIVQGSAGSGKTTVALHRLAWLLHENNSFASADNTQIIVMNKSLQVYVGATLPSMGIHGIKATTFNSWAFSFLKNVGMQDARFKYQELPLGVETIKCSEEMLPALEAYVKRQQQKLDSEIMGELQPFQELVVIWKKDVDRPLIDRLRELVRQLKNTELTSEIKSLVTDKMRSFAARLNDYQKDIYEIWSDSRFLKGFIPTTPQLERDLGFLQRRTEKNKQDKELDYFDLSLILRLIQLKHGGLPDKRGNKMALDHLVVDEAQDFGPIEFAVMMSAVRDKRDVTIVGDVAQKIVFSRKFVGWNKLMESLEIQKDELIQLEISFRCTAPIMTLARKVEGKPGTAEGRKGSEPKWIKTRGRGEMLVQLAEWVQKLQADNPNYLIALICRRPKQAMELKEEMSEWFSKIRLGKRDQFSFEPGIIVTNIHQVKGLEFDAVALVDVDGGNYPSTETESKNMLYVGITRAEDELALCATGAFSKILTG